MGEKRKLDPEITGGKAAKKSKPWQQKRQSSGRRSNELHHIETGSKGIWATCDRGNEHRASDEVLDILNTYAARLYPVRGKSTSPAVRDIESEIDLELQQSKESAEQVLFTPVKLDLQCVFFKTFDPVDPVELVHYICRDFTASNSMLKCRFVRRLTPAAVTGKANEASLEETSITALRPAFHVDPDVTKPFAIRTTIRNHSAMKKEDIISKIAQIVGSKHPVNLDNPEVVILVNIYKSICTMATVSGNYDRLKRYNLAELAKAAREGSEQAREDNPS